MSNTIVRLAGTAAVILAAQISFAQLNVGVNSTTQAATKVNTGVVNKAVSKTTGATKNVVSSTAQKTKQVTKSSANTVKSTASDVTGNTSVSVKGSGDVKRANSTNLNGTQTSSQNNANADLQVDGTVDASGATQEVNEVKTKTKETADGVKTKIKDKKDGAKTKIKEARPTVDAEGSIQTETKVKSKSGQ